MIFGGVRILMKNKVGPNVSNGAPVKRMGGLLLIGLGIFIFLAACYLVYLQFAFPVRSTNIYWSL
jgi:hypothetical protein